VAFFTELETEARARGLDFLVIGGLAVNFYGYSRDTADLDLLIQKDDRTAWLELFITLKYAVEHDAGPFVQLTPPQSGAWPVDLMLVAEPTFKPMLSESKEVDMYGARMRIPNLLHLLALKLHALKHTRAHRFLKDFQDVEGLVRINKLDLRAKNVRELFLKYGNLDLYEKIRRAYTAD
jgi:predicted nucleotidyltransferase